MGCTIDRWPRFLRAVLAPAVWAAAWGALFLALKDLPGLGPWAAPAAAGLVFASAWLGWVVRQAWIYPLRLRQAETLWAAGGYASDVVDLLAKIHLPTGELGHRVWLLRARANLALGFHNLAWAESEEAHLARLPFWIRPFLRRYLRRIPERSLASLDRTGRRWLRVAPAMPSLRWRLAIQFMREGGPERRDQAWRLLLEALPHAAGDPVLLDDLLLALLGRLQEVEQDAPRLGMQPGAPELKAAFERVLDLLVHGHGAPRLGWDRPAPAAHLLRSGRADEALAVVRTLPPELRPEALWVVMVAALRSLGGQEAAWLAVAQALDHQPDSFRLWMMQEDIALATHRNDEALAALERAGALVRDGGPLETVREWHTRRAEFAYWVENDLEEAARHLAFLPAELDAQGRPPLRLLLLLDQERYDEVHREVEPLLARHPDDPELQLIQAESLGGMEAWKALRDYLDTLGEAARQRSDFWHLRGICRSHLGNLLGSREDLERCTQLEPDNLRFLLDAGHACADLGEWERSEFHWRRALAQDERNEEALTQLAEARRTLHDPAGARRLLRECLLHHPESAAAQSMLAELEAN